MELYVKDPAASSTTNAALAYAAQGIPVFPQFQVRKNGKVQKVPLCPHGFKDATTDVEQIKKWWTDYPNAMIGMPTGSASGIDVLDLDEKDGRHGFAAVPDWRDLSEIIARSPSGGAHVWFKSDGTLRNSDAGNGVETKGEGGCITLPPSAGGGYRWEKGEPTRALLDGLRPMPDPLRPPARPERPAIEPTGDVDRDKIAAALAVVSADCGYREWFSIGGALCSALGDDGWEYFRDWSATSTKFDKRECLKQWKGCTTLTEFTINTLFYHAGAAVPGWESRYDDECMAKVMSMTEPRDPIVLPEFGMAPNAITGEMQPIIGGVGRLVAGPASVKSKGGLVRWALGLLPEHFWSFGPMNQFFFMASRALWPASSVDARLRPFPVRNADNSPKLNKKNEQVYMPASTWLSQHRSVETMTWAPGQPSIILDKTMTEDGGLIVTPGFKCFNTYRAPPPIRGKATEAGPWTGLAKKIYPDDAEHIFDYAAHRVQKPGEKINHCLALTGPPGIGKDTLLAAVLRSVGTWNCTEASPQDFFEAFNPHVKAVIMRINEAHDLGDVTRYSFYERMKIYAAAPPETLPVNDKNIRKYYIPNVCGIIITSNYRTDCLYLPADDRRHYVAWSDVTKENFEEHFWTDFWKWLNGGGDQHVAAWLAARDISKFDAKAPPKKTKAFWNIVDAGRPSEAAEIMDVIDALGNPDAVTIKMIKGHVAPHDPTHDKGCDLYRWFCDPRNVKQYSRRMENCDYTQVRNDGAKDGYWMVAKKRTPVYVKKAMTHQDQLKAIQILCGTPPWTTGG